MRKTAFMLTLTVILLCTLPIIAFAANENEASAIVTYTKDAPTPSNPDISPPAPPPATYEINIPATIAIDNPNAFTEFFITANNVNLSEGQAVVVYIDNDSFNDGENLHLKNSNNNTIRVSMRLRYNGYVTALTPNDVVAKFNHIGIPSSEYGTAIVLPFQDDVEAAPPGTYTGTLYYKIAVVNE